jgi:cyanophycin synthetase
MIYAEIIRRGLEVEIISAESSLLRFRHGDRWRLLRSTLSDRENALSFIIARNKEMTADICEYLNILHPRSMIVKRGDTVAEFIRDFGPVVIKPVNGAHGHGVTLDVASEMQLWESYGHAESESVIMQQMVKGDDYRVLMIGGRYVAAIKRIPASIIGDGVSTIRQLIIEENLKPERGRNYTTGKEEIPLELAERYLGERIDHEVPGPMQPVRVIDVPNLSAGGDAIDVTDTVPEEMIAAAKKIVTELQMGVCGVDFVWDGTGRPYLIEINATPGIDMHDDSRYGTPRGAVSAFVDYLLND